MMSSKNHDSKDKEPTLSPRRIHARRRSKSRACASPGRGPLNNGLMNAAWPKTPTYKVAKVNAGKIKNQPWMLREKISHLSDQVEEMEVDSHETAVMLSCGAATEFNVMKVRNGVDSKKSISENCDDVSNDRKSGKATSNDCKGVKQLGRKLSDPEQRLATTPNVIRKPDSSTSINSAKDDRSLKTSRREDSRALDATKDLTPIFIILHTGKVNIGNTSGHAIAPVKIYAERIIIQMEEEITKKNMSLRIQCKNIREIKMELESRPFFLKLKTFEIQDARQTKAKPKVDKSGNSLETVTFHLAYENEVPVVVKRDLKLLFKERLSHLNLWNESPSPTFTPSSDAPRDSRSPTGKKKGQEVETRVTDDEARAKIGCRKRTPVKHDDEQTVPLTPSEDRKLARRILFQDMDEQQERIKSLEHEAAHYQLLLGHKRLEIQRLEEQVRNTERNASLAREEAYLEINRRDQDINQLRMQVDSLNLQVSEEKDRMEACRRQTLELTATLDQKNLTMQEQQQAILVRESQLKEVRTMAISPSKMNETELREQIRRLENNLRQTRSTLEETRRSKTGISEELRRNVDILGNLREQLRSEASRNRRLENEATRATQQLNELVGSKRAIQVELNDERERVTSLERELLSCRRRIESEINCRMEAEGEIRSLRSVADEKDRVADVVMAERDAAVTEVGILKREIINLNEQLESALRNSQMDGDTGNGEVLQAGTRQSSAESYDWVIDRNEVIIQGAVLGVGGWGEVKLGRFHGTDVAVKQIHQLILSPHNRRLFNREMTIASRCRHPCLLQFIGATCDDGIPLFVSELLETDLRSHLSQKALLENEVLAVGLDIALALNYLHKKMPLPIIHRDISSSNVLLWFKGNEMHGKLSDYGAANFMRLSMTRHPGASLYSAPETASGEQTTKVDIYSFGVLFCEMSIRELPVAQQRDQQIGLIQNQEHRAYVQQCIEVNPSTRPNAEETIELFRRWRTQISL